MTIAISRCAGFITHCRPPHGVKPSRAAWPDLVSVCRRAGGLSCLCSSPSSASGCRCRQGRHCSQRGSGSTTRQLPEASSAALHRLRAHAATIWAMPLCAVACGMDALPSTSRLGAECAVGLYRAGDMHAVCARVRRRRAAGPRRSESGEPPLSTRAGRALRYSCALRASDAHWYQSALEGAHRVLPPVGIRRTERPTAAAGRVRRWRAARRSADRARAMRGRCR